VSIVNGAQTVGAIGHALADRDEGSDDSADARVLVRLISLENCPPEFGAAVTRATNTQNRIVSRDFVALDEQQERLRIELRIEGRAYALKTGDPDPAPEDGCSVVEATVALGCADSDPQTAVQVKREIGRIWEDTESPLYRRLFNSGTTSTQLWRCVQVMRVVDAEIRRMQGTEEGRRRQVAVHGNRLILHVVFAVLADSSSEEGEPDPEYLCQQARASFEAFCQKIDSDYQGNYLASLFKNQTKCRVLVDHALDSLAPRS